MEQESKEAEEEEATRAAAAATSRSDSSAPRPSDQPDGDADSPTEDLRDELLPRSVCLNVAELFEADKLRLRPPPPQQRQPAPPTPSSALLQEDSGDAQPVGVTAAQPASAESQVSDKATQPPTLAPTVFKPDPISLPFSPQGAVVASPRSPSNAAPPTPTPPALTITPAPSTRQGPTSPTASATSSIPAAPQMAASEREKRRALMQLLNPIQVQPHHLSPLSPSRICLSVGIVNSDLNLSLHVAVQLPVLELAFFPRELQGELVGLDARTAVGSVITGLVTFRETLVWDRIAGDAQDKVRR